MSTRKSVEIIEAGNMIIIHHKKSNTDWIVSNTANVRSVLRSSRTHLFCKTYKKDVRLKVSISYNKAYNKKSIYFHRLIYACYHEGLSAKNISEIYNLNTKWNELNLQIDHLDGDKYNNCMYNLSLMSQHENSRKGRKNLRIRNMFNLCMAYVNNVYVVQLTYPVSSTRRKELKSVRYFRDSPKELNDLITKLFFDKWNIREKQTGDIATNDYYISYTRCMIPLVKSKLTKEELQNKLANSILK